MGKPMNSYSNRQNEDKSNHLENRETANNTVVHGSEDEGDNEEPTIQRVSHHRRKGKELDEVRMRGEGRISTPCCSHCCP